MPDLPNAGETHLIAGPPPANPPLLVAFLIVLVSLAAPFLFLRAHSPSLWLTSAVLALACAGVIAMLGAVDAQRKRRADPTIRVRAVISAAGVTFHATPTHPAGRFYPTPQIEHAALLNGAIILHMDQCHSSPGRHILRFGRLACPRDPLVQALAVLQTSKVSSQSRS